MGFRGVVPETHGSGFVCFLRLFCRFDVLVSWWDECMKDAVLRLALFVSMISGGVCDIISAVRVSRILTRDLRLLLS